MPTQSISSFKRTTLVNDQRKHDENHAMREAMAEGVSDVTIRGCSNVGLKIGGDSSLPRGRGGVHIGGDVDDLYLSGSYARNMQLLDVDGHVDRLVQNDNHAVVDDSGRASFRVGHAHIGNVGAARDRARRLAKAKQEFHDQPRGKSMASIPELRWKRKGEPAND
jgi:hypothetical protein